MLFRSEETANQIREKKFANPNILIGDQSDEKVSKETIASTISNFGGLDGLVLNAGIPVAGSLEELSIEKWRHGLEVNLTSAFLLTKFGLQALRTQGMGGSLVYIASKNAFAPGAGFGGYSVSKSGMIQLMRIAALEEIGRAHV